VSHYISDRGHIVEHVYAFLGVIQFYSWTSKVNLKICLGYFR